MKKNISNTR